MPVVAFQDLPLADATLGDRSAAENAILGDPPNWERYRKAHVWYDSNNADKKAGYKLIIAKEIDGVLHALWPNVVAAVAVLNGGRGGADIPAADRKAAFNHLLRYYDKRGVEAKDQPKYAGSRRASASLGFGPAVALLATPAADGAAEDPIAPVWVQVAREGRFNGYAGGAMPFAFERKHFEQMVANLRAHPSFTLGANGEGTEPIIPWDFNHASEMDPTSGSLPVAGAPAQAWTLDLQIRTGTDGKAELWALTRFLEPARSSVREGKYRWSSLAVTFDAIHPVTGANIGALITSIALTNTPFIEGMQELAASRGVRAMHGPMGYYGPASSAEDALECIRSLLGLPATAGVDEVAPELDKLAAWVGGGEPPMGVELDDLVGALRQILNLPALSSAADVVTEAKSVAGKLVEETPPPPPAPTATRTNMELINLLSALLGVAATQEAVLAAVNTTIALRAKAETDGGAVRAKLKALAEALGIDDADGAVERVAELMSKSKELAAVMPELEGLRSQVKKLDDAAIESDVADALASRGLGAEHKPALTLYRRADAAGFLASYPKIAAHEGTMRAPAGITRPIATTPAGGEMRVGPDGAGIVMGPAGRSAPGEVLKVDGVVNLSRFPGRNPTERAYAYLRANYTGWDKLTPEDQFVIACGFKRQVNVIDQATA